MGPRVTVSPPAGPAEALTIATCEVLVHNPGPEPDEFRFEVLGEAARWSWFSPITVELPAGGDGSTRACFRLPRSPQPAAGPFPVRVKVTSVRRPAESTVAGTDLEVAPFADLFATIDPRLSHGVDGAEHVVCVENRGNSPMPTRLRAEAVGGRLDVAVDPPAVVSPPGGSVTATVTVRPTGRSRRDTDPVQHFQVVAEPESGHPQRVEGAFRQEAGASRRPLVLVALVVLVALAGGGALLASTRSTDDEGARADPDVEAADVTPRRGPCPAEGHLNRDRRTSGELPFSYSFLFSDPAGCVPVRFDPCRPIHYVTNDALAPAGALDDLREAFARISRASGMEFVHDGSTDERWAPDRVPYQPDRYGRRWAPILVTWSALGNEGRDDVIIAGRGNPVVVEGVIVTGHLDLNVDARTDQARTRPLENGFGEGITWGRVMLHELSHVFGLGHVESTSNLMHEELTEHTLRTAEFGIGDLQAYRIIGRDGGCVPAPTLPAS